ncbi:MAG: histidinol-phosphate transaminase [Brevinematales bacterium]|nr:histidinol-phosphate transaminase [Brevinematales bacterium]
MYLRNLAKIPNYVSGTKDVSCKLRLSSNENNYGPSPKVRELIRKISKDAYKYPNSSYFSLKEILSDHNKVSVDNIILGNGSDEIFLYLFFIFLDENSSIVTLEKTFTYYKILASIVGAEVIEARRGKNFSISCENILSSIRPSTKIVVFPSPDNPTGVITNRECLEKILGSISPNTLFILDEAYFQFVPEDKYWNSIELINKYDNLVVTRTFSKLYGLAGVRIGYGVCSSSITKIYEKVRMPFNLSLFASEVVKQALLDNEYYSRVLRQIVNDREKMKKSLKKLGIWVLEESYGNFVFIRGPQKLDEKLLNHGILIRNLKSFGYDETFYRITVGTTNQNKILIKTISKIVC